MGYRFGDRFVKLSQNDRNSIIKKIQDITTRNRYLFSQQLNDENFNNIINEIIRYKPTVLRGYPDPLFFLAKFAKRHQINDLTIPLITTTGNILFSDVRSLIEEQFHGKIYDSYSCEGSANFFEVPAHNFYYGTMEYAITEIMRDNSHVDFGEEGRHITTDLHNYAMPFIRYDTQDYLVRETREINSTKDLQLNAIIKILGRDSDILITPTGKYLIVHNFTGFFQRKELETVKQFQVIQTNIDTILIKIVVDEYFDKKTFDFITKYWMQYIGDNMDVTIDVVDTIELSPSGKRRFLIRNSNVTLNF